MVIFGVFFVCAFKNLKCSMKGVVGKADLAHHARCLGLGLDAGEADAVLDRHHLHAFERAEEIIMPPGPAAFAVRDAGKADFLLLGDQTPDRFILDGFELAGADLAPLALGSRLLHLARAQQAAHMIGAKGRDRALHGGFLIGCDRC